MNLREVLEALLESLAASRVTLRQDALGDVFPVTHEALATGAPSIRNVKIAGMAQLPVVVRVLRGEQVVQADSLRAYPDDELFQEMLKLYGDLRAQIVTPIVIDGKTRAILSVHQLHQVRPWTQEEIDECRQAATQVAELISE